MNTVTYWHVLSISGNLMVGNFLAWDLWGWHLVKWNSHKCNERIWWMCVIRWNHCLHILYNIHKFKVKCRKQLWSMIFLSYLNKSDLRKGRPLLVGGWKKVFEMVDHEGPLKKTNTWNAWVQRPILKFVLFYSSELWTGRPCLARGWGIWQDSELSSGNLPRRRLSIRWRTRWCFLLRLLNAHDKFYM